MLIFRHAHHRTEVAAAAADSLDGGGLNGVGGSWGRFSVCLRGEGIFSGNGRSIFFGIIIGALGIAFGGYLFSNHQQLDYPPRKLLRVITHSVSSSPHSTATPEPVMVQIHPEAVHVTAISLGHPRLAVINGTSVAEGDSVVIHTPDTGVVVRLRVVSIGDGRVDLRNGKQLICARLKGIEPVQKGAALKR